MSYGVSNTAIADKLGISRQAVSRHRRRGMPCESIEAALSWYQHNVDGRRRRGMFSRLPHRPRPTRSVTVESDSTSSDRIIRELEGREQEPEPIKLDSFPEGFWGEDAPTEICKILAGEKGKGIKSKEDVCAAFSCLDAAKRLHLCLMPEQVAKTLPERDRERITEALSEWVDLFCRHWWGSDYQTAPILPEATKALDEFYRPL